MVDASYFTYGTFMYCILIYILLKDTSYVAYMRNEVSIFVVTYICQQWVKQMLQLAVFWHVFAPHDEPMCPS